MNEQDSDSSRIDPTVRFTTAMLLDAFGPERLMWASDWPHTDTGLNRVTTYPQTLRWFEEWVTDKATRQTFLVDTPARLYGFLRS